MPFDKVGALEQWFEQGKAPERLIASHSTDGKVDRTRPLCPYPQVAKYKGSGSIDEAANFVCRVPQRVSQKSVDELSVGRASPPAPDRPVRLATDCEKCQPTDFLRFQRRPTRTRNG